MGKRTLKQADLEIAALSIMLKQHIATENALRARIKRLTSTSLTIDAQRKIVRPRRMDDGQWAVFQGEKQMGLFASFSDCAAKCEELATAH